MTPPYPKLCSPISIGPITLNNRAYVAGHSMLLSDSTGVTERYRAYLVERAEGGAAMVGIESAPVHLSSRDDTQNPLPLYSDIIVPSLAKAADAVHAAGSRLMLVMQHRGSHVSHIANHAPAIAPSAVPDIRTGDIPRVASIADLAEIRAAYGAAAARCLAAGVDVLEIMGALDYLIGAFLHPALNVRTDAYGGSVENRARLLMEILETVREATGGATPIGVRLTVGDVVNEDDEIALQRVIATARLITAQGLVDYINIIRGSYRNMDNAMPAMHLPRIGLAEQSRRLREAVNVPVSFAGRIRTPREAEDLLAKGHADLIAMGRTWIADPHWMSKLEAGNEDQIRPCISCNQGCTGFLLRAMPASCIVNPRAGRELEFGPLVKASNPRHVAVVGGGPAGLEAARMAALRGHRVQIFERSKRLGGDMALAASDPQRDEMQLAIDWWTRELNRLGVEILVDHDISIDAPPEADELIWAIGAKPSQVSVQRYRPQLAEGIPGAEALPHGRAILRGERRAHGRVLVIDEEGGWPALVLTEAVRSNPDVTDVTVITTERGALGESHTSFTLEVNAAAARVARPGLEVRLGMLATLIENRCVEASDGTRMGPFDTIILSTGTSAPEMPEGSRLAGDCLAPRGIWAAASDGHAIALSI